jgi:hypothetical protein
MLDKIIFGDEKSENSHEFNAPLSTVKIDSEGRSRIALPTNPHSRFSGEYSFKLAVDPIKQNFFSIKMWSGDSFTPLFLLIDGKQLGYAKCGDYEALNLGHGNFSPHAFFYSTTVIPLSYTKGKREIFLTLRHAQQYDPIGEVHGRIFEGFTHTEPWVELEGVKLSPRSLPVKKYSEAETAALSEGYIKKQQSAFLESLSSLRRGEKISITKYVESFRQFCMILFEPYCPLQSSAEKGEAVSLVLNCIDLYVRDYFADVRTLAHTSHQSDWGGYYGELGQGLYILSPLIKDDKIFGNDKFFAYLNEPFNCDTNDGEFSVCGKSITRKSAWERCLKANFDFASSRQSYIYNQVYYTYEGAWKSMAGLGVIDSSLYIGDERCSTILLEALGIAPWKGEHILTDKNGRELNLYHCLFHHDRAAEFTDDFLRIVCKGEAVQMTDKNGNFVRRKPYGDNYFSLSHKALTRENGYVGNYGETANYLPEWVYRTWNHGDLSLSDKILKTSLKNIHARSFMRYQSVDDAGFRVMHMEQGTDERNPSMHGKIAYGADVNDGRCYLFASLKRHMDENSSRYAAPSWDEYKRFADEAVDFLRQQHSDGRLSEKLESLSANYNDFRLDRTIPYILNGNITHFLPHTDFSLYSKDEVENSSKNQFAWTDIDTLTLSLKDGDTSIFAQLNLRNRGYCAVGRAHVRRKNMSHLMQFTTDALFCSKERFIRPQNVNMDFICDKEGSNSFFRSPSPLREFAAVPQALCGEEIPVTFQKGVGDVLRENFAVDTPFSGYPDVIWTKLGKYFIVFNTTRPSYENDKTFSVPVPESGSLFDMVSEKYVSVQDGKISVPPFTSYVLKLSSTDSEISLPENIKIFSALPDKDSVLLHWKESAKAEKYVISKNGKTLAVTEGNIFRDDDVERGLSYTYTVKASNAFGSSSPVKTSCAVPSSIFDIGEGERRFGEGNDYKALERSISDSILFNAKACCNSMSVCAAGGVMLRENASPDAVYAFLGMEKGEIVLRTRSKNTMYCPNEKISPLIYKFKYFGEKYFKLILDSDLHSVIAYVSNDSLSWRFLDRVVLPFPATYYAGTASFDLLGLSDPFIKEENTDFPFPISRVQAVRSNGKCSFEIEKGLDNKYIASLRSFDGVNYTTVADNIISQSFTDECGEGDVYYKFIPYNRLSSPGEPYIIKV